MRQILGIGLQDLLLPLYQGFFAIALSISFFCAVSSKPIPAAASRACLACSSTVIIVVQPLSFMVNCILFCLFAQ